jgi:hypothetical protein
VPDAAVASVRLVRPPAERARFYRSLALALAATAPPAGALFEWAGRDPGTWVTVRPAALAATVRAAPASGVGSLRPGPAPPPPPRPPGTVERFGVLVPHAGPSGGPGIPVGAAERPGLGGVVPPGAEVAVQTFWVRGGGGTIAVARRFAVRLPSERAPDPFDAVATVLARDWADRWGVPVAVAPAPRATAHAWRRGAPKGIAREAWRTCVVRDVDRTVEVPDGDAAPTPAPDGHAIVWGASGAGKTSLLARWAAETVAAGTPVLAIDLHGDLAPAIVARLRPSDRARVVAVDAGTRPVAGIAALPPDDPDPERAAAQLVAALKRLTPDGTDLYWGFRLERIFDTVVRVVQEQRGSLLDVYALLTDADRRDAARLGTRRPELAAFLEELAPVVRRNPEFLWSAATRLSKVGLVPALGELLAPPDGGVPVEALLAAGRSVLVRLPFAALGPEAAQFAGTLVLGRLYLGVAAAQRTAPVGLVLDEVQGFSPRLVAEIVTEARKFGVRALLASQYPDRLAPEVRAAAAGALSACVAFRVPRAAAREVGAWLGLPAADADALLPELPLGHAVATGFGDGALRAIGPAGEAPRPDDAAWATCVAATRAEFDVRADPAPRSDRAEEAVLLAVLAAEEARSPLRPEALVAAALALPGPERDPAAVAEVARRLRERGEIVVDALGCRLSAAGARWLGLGAPTGATKESPRHRALLLRAFRLFARRGVRLEIVRQGRFDTTLPDAVFRQLPDPARTGPPIELERTLARVRAGWAWRCFGGRDVHLEAEVTGARRAARIGHDWRKAERRGAFLVVAVDEARDARRAREILRGLGVGPDRAQVWHLAPVLAEPPKA